MWPHLSYVPKCSLNPRVSQTTKQSPSCPCTGCSPLFLLCTSGPKSNFLPAVLRRLSLELLFLSLELSQLEQLSASSADKVWVSVTAHFPAIPRVQDLQGSGCHRAAPSSLPSETDPHILFLFPAKVKPYLIDCGYFCPRVSSSYSSLHLSWPLTLDKKKEFRWLA